MPIIQTIRDLFRSGGVAIAEQFVRGRSKIKSFRDLLVRKFGPDIGVEQQQLGEFLTSVTRAGNAAGIVEQGLPVPAPLIPEWLASQTPGEMIQTGLARITMGEKGGEPLMSTHIPFEFHNLEILNLEDIRNRIKQAIDAGKAPEEAYNPDVDRIDALLRYHSVMGAESSVEIELYSLFQGVP